MTSKLTANQIRSAIELYAKKHNLSTAIVRHTQTYREAALAEYRRRLAAQKGGNQ